ncbi:MAG: hypothetical protein AAFR28_11335 [Pseudomonadota bacterium]
MTAPSQILQSVIRITLPRPGRSKRRQPIGAAGVLLHCSRNTIRVIFHKNVEIHQTRSARKLQSHAARPTDFNLNNTPIADRGTLAAIFSRISPKISVILSHFWKRKDLAFAQPLQDLSPLWRPAWEIGAEKSFTEASISAKVNEHPKSNYECSKNAIRRTIAKQFRFLNGGGK